MVRLKTNTKYVKYGICYVNGLKNILQFKNIRLLLITYVSRSYEYQAARNNDPST